jgi:hypothetical protein
MVNKQISGHSSRPRVYLLIMLPILFIGGLGVPIALMAIFARLRGIQLRDVPDFNGLLISLPAFFLWIPVTYLLGNLILYFIPALRRTAESYVEAAGRPGFRDSQVGLLKACAVFALVCIPLIAIGFAL